MKNFYAKFTSLFLLLALIGTCANAQVAKLHALYIFQFAKNVGWPPEDASKDLVVAVLGDEDVVGELSEIAGKMKIGNRKIEVREVKTAQNIGDADIVFVASRKSALVGSVAAKLASHKSLVVSADKGQCPNGASISFYPMPDNKVGFEISEGNVKRAGLSISPRLLKLGKVVG